MLKQDAIINIRDKYQQISPYLNEQTRRIWAATEALGLGYGGITSVSEATGLSHNTIRSGLGELAGSSDSRVPAGMLRSRGGGRKALTQKDASLKQDLDSLVEPTSRGDPESPLRWSCKSVVKLAWELQAMGHQICSKTVATLLKDMGYSLQGNRKTQEGKHHPDRDRQFVHINRRVREFQMMSAPVISVDTKKKELVGNFKNAGVEWEPTASPTEVKTHDFIDPELGKAIPYGVYDLRHNQAWVSIGIDHDTAAFAVETIRQWWQNMGKPLYQHSQELLITADCGGSNGYRSRLWKLKLQEFADETGLTVHVCHFPPGTSKWNRIEHRLFCHITQNWRGRPLESLMIIVNLISHTTTFEGLQVSAELDKNHYEIGIKVSDEDFNAIEISKDVFHGEWNYQISPRTMK
ncbi:ISAzo13 family transposase [Microcoleus sp. Pol14C2]|uniref:ISAzo13 family transposase n=1 Tax=unclassified Microcoleus TaxID=2642155 RepID=UPI002FD0A1C0